MGPRLWITAPALILLMPIYAMYALFSAQHPNLLKLAEYKEQFKDVCWEATHAYREGWRARPV